MPVCALWEALIRHPEFVAATEMIPSPRMLMVREPLQPVPFGARRGTDHGGDPDIVRAMQDRQLTNDGAQRFFRIVVP